MLVRKFFARFSSVSFWLRISASLTLVALALMVWSVLVPTPMPVMLAMTIGQGLGTTAFAIYGLIVLKDLTRVRRAKRDSLLPSTRTAVQNIALSKDADEILARRDSLQNIGLAKDDES
jgi:hypothetical protein